MDTFFFTLFSAFGEARKKYKEIHGLQGRMEQMVDEVLPVGDNMAILRGHATFKEPDGVITDKAK